MEQPQQKGPCKGCLCGPIRRIMNVCIKNNGEEKCEEFRRAFKECQDFYKSKEQMALALK